MDCPFCSPAVQAEKFAECEHFFALFDRHPVTPGHAIVVSRRHVALLSDLMIWEMNDLLPFAAKVEQLIRETRLSEIYQRFSTEQVSEYSVWYANRMLAHVHLGQKPSGFNHGANCGKVAGQTLLHFNWHVIPRYPGDVHNPAGGVRCIIPEMGNWKKARV